MIKNFVTISDYNFIPQSLTLNDSLSKNVKQYKLFIICLDLKSYNFYESLSYEFIQPINLSIFETQELKEIKKKRTRAEYSWTVTPLAPLLVFENFNEIDEITYLDSDMFFLKSPITIYEEFYRSNKDILITKHNYTDEYDFSKSTGNFCVQFLIIKNNQNAKAVIENWFYQCKEWCYSRVEDGKFGDQKYLDQWPIKFSNYIHIFSERTNLLAPWNASLYDKNDCIAWHFHGLRILPNNKVLLYSNYYIPKRVHDEVYNFYYKKLIKIVKQHKLNIVQKQKENILIKFLKYIKSLYMKRHFINRIIKHNTIK